MKDSKITKKHHPAGSLARRILIIAILLLVSPLFLQSFFLYRQEYAQKKADVIVDLKLLASERAHLIAEIMQMDWRILEESRQPHVKLSFIQKISLPQNISERFILVDRKRSELLIGMTGSDKNALGIPLSFSLLTKEIEASYPIQIALLDQTKNILWENQALNGKFLQAIHPIQNTGLSIQLAVSENRIEGLHRQQYYFRFATLLFFVGIFGGGAVYLFAKRINRPLKNLCKTMQKVSDGAIHARYSPDQMGFEINALGIQFNETLDALLLYMQTAEKERLTREKLAAEFQLGHEIQTSLLPTHIPGFPGLDIASRYFSSKEVNGDFYDLFRLDNGKILLAICDTAGKGISACLFSLGLRSIIRALANTTQDVAELIKRANDVYWVDAHESSMFSTLWLGIYDPEKQTLSYCNQGHPPALLVRSGTIEELSTPGIALGAQMVDIVHKQKALLQKGDLLVLYTDGIIEAHNSNHELFGKNRLKELLLLRINETAGQMTDLIIENVQIFSRNMPMHDDITLLIITVQ